MQSAISYRFNVVKIKERFLIAATVVSVIAHSAATGMEYLRPESGPPVNRISGSAVWGWMGGKFLVRAVDDHVMRTGKEGTGDR